VVLAGAAEITTAGSGGSGGDGNDRGRETAGWPPPTGEQPSAWKADAGRLGEEGPFGTGGVAGEVGKAGRSSRGEDGVAPGLANGDGLEQDSGGGTRGLASDAGCRGKMG